MEKAKRKTPPIPLRTIRMVAGLNPTQVAGRLQKNRSCVWDLERKGPWNARISTVTQYVEAIGGKVELWVTLPDGTRVQLKVDRPS